MGAKFSSGGGATVFYDDGPITAPSGEQGTQRTEFEAAIKSVTSSTTVGAVFVYDTRNDSDSGAWRKKCAGLSWFDETLNTATRGGRREFPSVALIVSDSASGVTIYDLDDPAMPMWMVFNGLSGDWATKMLWASGNVAGGGLVALNGRVILGRTWVDFASDEGGYYHTSFLKKYGGGISDRNATSLTFEDTSGAIAHNTVNDVAATVLEGAEIGALGLPEVTIGVATNDGVSVIHGGSGAVYDIKGNQTYKEYKKVFFTDDGKVGFNYEASGTQNRAVFTGIEPIPYADKTTGGIDWAVEKYAEGNYGNHASNEFGLATTTSLNSSNDAIPNAVIPTTKTGLAFGYPDRLSIVKRNTGYDKDGAVAYITSDYNTGYMLGDIRLALAVPYASSSHGYSNGNTIGDRSVKANNLTTSAASGQQVTAVPVATDAETFAFSNFSSSNYLERTDANLGTTMDFGTGDFSVVFWVKTSVASVASGESDDIENYIARMDNSLEAGDWVILKQADTTGVTLQFYRHSGSSWAKQNETAVGVMPANTWTQVVFSKKGNDYQFYINGKKSGNKTSNPNSYSSNSSFTIGHALGNSGPADSSSLSLVRISATAPTPQQVKDIYEAEKPLFRAGAKCLLQGDNSAVQGLAYDKTTGLLQATQTAGTTKASATIFRGLEVADTFLGNAHDSNWTYNSATLLAANGGVSAYYRSGGSLLCDLPAIDVRGDINTADTKLRDDGKLHFTGVTTDATPTVIGNIPIAENEAIQIITRVEGCRYNQASSSRHILAEIKQQFYRDFGGNVTARSEASKLVQEGLASLDVDLTVNTTAQTVEVKCTGTADVPRMQWKAEVQVQRISERSYER